MASTIFDPQTRSVNRGGELTTNNERLESWKEIAAYLNRTVRTVRRWEESEGLPVLRHEHHKQATVYAFRGELDAWLAQRQPEAAPRGSSSPNGQIVSPQTAGMSDAATAALQPSPGFFIPRWLIVSGATAGIGFALFVLYGLFFDNWRFMIVL